jgi:hypothetical protein
VPLFVITLDAGVPKAIVALAYPVTSVVDTSPTVPVSVGFAVCKATNHAVGRVTEPVVKVHAN